MSVDKFGRYQDAARGATLRGPPGEGFKFTTDGDYDMEHKRLRNVGANELSNTDAVSLEVLKHYERQLHAYASSKYTELSEEVKTSYETIKTHYTDITLKLESMLIQLVNDRVTKSETESRKYVDAVMEHHRQKAIKEATSAYNTIEPILSETVKFQKDFRANVERIVQEKLHPAYEVILTRGQTPAPLPTLEESVE